MLDFFNNYFFAPEGTHPKCGIFTAPHLISLVICIAIIGVCVYFSRNISKKGLTLITRVMAFVFTALELIKIFFKFKNNAVYQLDHWLPLAFCSLFIYTLWMSGYGKGLIKKLGDMYIVGGCFCGGLAFLIFPLTSFNITPIYHFLSMHSMLFHSCMVYMAIMYIYKGVERVDLKNYKYYFFFVGGAAVLSVIINTITIFMPDVNPANLMIMRELFGFPLDFVNQFTKDFPWIYTPIAFAVYTLVPYFIVYGFLKLVAKIRGKKKEN